MGLAHLGPRHISIRKPKSTHRPANECTVREFRDSIRIFPDIVGLEILGPCITWLTLCGRVDLGLMISDYFELQKNVFDYWKLGSTTIIEIATCKANQFSGLQKRLLSVLSNNICLCLLKCGYVLYGVGDDDNRYIKYFQGLPIKLAFCMKH